jgi:hypothetical protein
MESGLTHCCGPLTFKNKKGGRMSAHYDGKHMFRILSKEPIFEVRGKYVFNSKCSQQPLYEICGRYMYEYMHAGQPEYRIDDDNRVFELKDRTQPRFELR